MRLDRRQRLDRMVGESMIVTAWGRRIWGAAGPAFGILTRVVAVWILRTGPVTFIGVAGFFQLLGTTAGVAPAIRAARVNCVRPLIAHFVST
jgi:hypothetical protein